MLLTVGFFCVLVLKAERLGMVCRNKSPPNQFENRNFKLNGGNILKSNNVYSLRNVKSDKSGDFHYFVSFTDGNGNLVETEVSECVYNQLLNFRKKNASEGRSDRRHIEKSEQTEESISLKSFIKELPLDEVVIKNIKNEDLRNAIQELSAIQQKRVEMYFFQGKKLREIGAVDNCTPQAVHKSLKRALMKLYCILSKKGN